MPETLPAPSTSSLQNYEKINICCLRHPVSGLYYGSLRKPIHFHSALSSSFYCCHLPGPLTEFTLCCFSIRPQRNTLSSSNFNIPNLPCSLSDYNEILDGHDTDLLENGQVARFLCEMSRISAC